MHLGINLLILLKSETSENDYFKLFIAMTILFFVEIVFKMIIKRNEYKLDLKTKAKDIFVAKIEDFTISYGKSSGYILDVEYEDNQGKHKKRIFTHGRFAKKYEHAEEVRIVVIPETGMVFLEEETWKEDNFVLRIMFYGTAIILVPGILILLCEFPGWG